jgi:hypothetical protein
LMIRKGRFRKPAAGIAQRSALIWARKR